MITWNKDVDVLVGLQYGDEGKGMVSKLMADREEEAGHPYLWTGRVGGQNAEHRFIHDGCEMCARILPSASAFRNNIWAVLGAGHCFRPEQLAMEALHMGVPLDRIIVDPRAMWLKPEHATQNAKLGEERGTTGWGIGAAISEKVRRSKDTQLIGDSPEMIALFGHNLQTASSWLAIAGHGLIEGSQGTMLSLNHGHWPFCTAKDVTAPALLTEMGVPPKRLNRVIGCARMVFMRVPGESGPTGGIETSYSEIEERTGLRIPLHKRLQGDAAVAHEASSKQEERLFDIGLEELEIAIQLNGVDMIALTFADYHRPGNYRVKTWDKLHPDTQQVVRYIDNTMAQVVLVRTGQGEHDNLWL